MECHLHGMQFEEKLCIIKCHLDTKYSVHVHVDRVHV